MHPELVALNHDAGCELMLHTHEVRGVIAEPGFRLTCPQRQSSTAAPLTRPDRTAASASLA